MLSLGSFEFASQGARVPVNIAWATTSRPKSHSFTYRRMRAAFDLRTPFLDKADLTF